MIEDKIQAEEAVERITKLQARIAAAEKDFRDFKDYFEQKILAAQKIFEDSTKADRDEILMLTENLRAFAETRLTGKKRSLPLPTATLQFRKQSPRFFFDGTEVTARDQKLLDFVKRSAPDYLKTKVEEYADWSNFKRKLVADGEKVFFADTGEVVDDLRVQILPDKFEVKFP